MIMLTIYVLLGGKEQRFFRTLAQMELYLKMTGKWMRYLTLQDWRKIDGTSDMDDLEVKTMSFYG